MGFLSLLFKEIGWFILALVVIGVIWFWGGGTENPSAHEPYIKPLAPLNTGETYGNVYLSHDNEGKKLDLPENPITTILNFFGNFRGPARTEPSGISFSKIFIIDGVAGAEMIKPQEEYLRILASRENKSSNILSGLTITGSAYSTKEIIPQAVNKLVLGSPMEKSDVFMPSQGRAIIASGKSPIGSSFRTNACTGYLGQFQSFTPDLLVACPAPTEELKKYGPYEDLDCRDFVERLPPCRSYGGTFPNSVSASCRRFVTEKLSYNACVADHVTDANFYKDEWRLFLGKDKELWKDKQEVIRLYDAKGIIIDGITY